jgi:hypothetical protein
MATNLTIVKGKTFSRVIRWSAAPYLYKPITAITKAAPVVITSAGHGIPDGWQVAVVSVVGMKEINETIPTSARSFSSVSHKATVADANSISINDINSSQYTAYTSGGYIQMLSPVDLTSYTARMSIKDRVGGTELIRLSTANGRIVVDNTNKVITLTLEAAATAALTWRSGVYDLEMIGPAVASTDIVSGKVYTIASVGTTDFTLVGATANTVGLSFTATGVGVGTGTVEGVVDLIMNGKIAVTDEVTTT